MGLAAALVANGCAAPAHWPGGAWSIGSKAVPWQQIVLEEADQGSHAAGIQVKGPTSDLNTSALLASTKSNRSSTKGLGSEGAFSQLSMPSLAAGGSRQGQSACWHTYNNQQSNPCPGGSIPGAFDTA